MLDPYEKGETRAAIEVDLHNKEKMKNEILS